MKECYGAVHSLCCITCVHIRDNKISNDGKLEMVEFDRQWWLTHEVFEGAFFFESEVTHIHNLTAFNGNTANALLMELCGIGTQ